MSEQIVQVADASPSTKNMRTIQQTAGGNTVQSEVIVLATGAANGSDTYDARQIRALNSADVVTAILQGVTLGQKTMANSLPVVIASNQSAIPISGTVTSNQGTANSLANAWPVKITDGTSSLSFYSEADVASSLLGTAVKGAYVQAELVGLPVSGTSLLAATIGPSGFGNAISVAGSYSDNTSIGLPDATVDKQVNLIAIANANPPFISESGLGFLSMDLNRSLRVLPTTTPNPSNLPKLSTDQYGNLNTTNNHVSQAAKGGWGPGWGNVRGW